MCTLSAQSCLQVLNFLFEATKFVVTCYGNHRIDTTNNMFYRLKKKYGKHALSQECKDGWTFFKKSMNVVKNVNRLKGNGKYSHLNRYRNSDKM